MTDPGRNPTAAPFDASLSRRQLIGGMAAAGLASPPARARQTRSRDRWDLIVIGAGVFGAWIAWNLQRRGKRVLLVDAWGVAHNRSSSGGETRLIVVNLLGRARVATGP